MNDQTRYIFILRRREVEARTGLSRSTLYDWINPDSPRYKPDFPKPIRFAGSSAVGWVASEVTSWLGKQIEQRDLVAKGGRHHG